MSLPTTPKGWAIRLAKLIAAVHQVHGLPRFPIDVEAIAREFSRQVFPDAPITTVQGLDLSKGIEGMPMPDPGGSGEWGIIYNKATRSRGRQNFTLAHELGHYLLHRQDHPRRSTIEAEANTFASYLLRQEGPQVREAEAVAALKDFGALWSQLFPAE